MKFIRSAVLLSVSLVDSARTDGAKWVQVCTEGTFLGHPKFAKINWTRATFEALVRNFRKNPAFRAGPDGVGCARVVPWDYEHANEMRRMNGNIPPDGLPAASWTQDLQIRTGQDGKAELWALTEWLPLARSQIQAGEYQGCSVCVQMVFIDPVSGKDQGPTLTSIALTNDPFVQGMTPLAATRKGDLPTTSKDNAPATGSSNRGDPRLEKVVQEINACPGRNALERVNAWMERKCDGHSALDKARALQRANGVLQDIQLGIWPKEFDCLGVESAETDQELVAALNSMPGRNPVEKANALLCRRSKAHAARPLAEQCRVAGSMLRQIVNGGSPIECMRRSL